MPDVATQTLQSFLYEQGQRRSNYYKNREKYLAHKRSNESKKQKSILEANLEKQKAVEDENIKLKRENKRLHAQFMALILTAEGLLQPSPWSEPLHLSSVAYLS